MLGVSGTGSCDAMGSNFEASYLFCCLSCLTESALGFREVNIAVDQNGYCSVYNMGELRPGRKPSGKCIRAGRLPFLQAHV